MHTLRIGMLRHLDKEDTNVQQFEKSFVFGCNTARCERVSERERQPASFLGLSSYSKQVVCETRILWPNNIICKMRTIYKEEKGGVVYFHV